MTDLELLAAWREGDASAGDRLVRRHFEPVYLFFRNKVAVAEVEDLTQKTFLKCTESKDRFRGEAPFRVYLLAIARNELYQHLRRHKAAPGIVDVEAHSIEAIGTTPSGFVLRQREHQILLQALRKIPVAYQIALELYFWDDLSAPQMAIVLGVPEGTVRSWIRRGRLGLEKEIAALRAGETPLESTDANLRDWALSLRDAARAEIGEEAGS